MATEEMVIPREAVSDLSHWRLSQTKRSSLYWWSCAHTSSINVSCAVYALR